MSVDLSEEACRKAEDAMRAGASVYVAARSIGACRATLYRAAARGQIDLSLAAAAKRGPAVGSAPKQSVPVPKWVPAWLRDEYREFARLYDEEGAASICRRLKADAERAVV